MMVSDFAMKIIKDNAKSIPKSTDENPVLRQMADENDAALVRIVATPPSMIMSTQKPTKPGWYWAMLPGYQHLQVVHVRLGEFPDGLMFSVENEGWHHLSECNPRWQFGLAPLDEPEFN